MVIEHLHTPRSTGHNTEESPRDLVQNQIRIQWRSHISNKPPGTADHTLGTRALRQLPAKVTTDENLFS